MYLKGDRSNIQRLSNGAGISRVKWAIPHTITEVHSEKVRSLKHMLNLKTLKGLDVSLTGRGTELGLQ